MLTHHSWHRKEFFAKIIKLFFCLATWRAEMNSFLLLMHPRLCGMKGGEKAIELALSMSIFGMKLPLSSALNSIPFTGRSTSSPTQAKEEESSLLEKNQQEKTPSFRLPWLVRPFPFHWMSKEDPFSCLIMLPANMGVWECWCWPHYSQLSQPWLVFWSWKLGIGQWDSNCTLTQTKNDIGNTKSKEKCITPSDCSHLKAASSQLVS